MYVSHNEKCHHAHVSLPVCPTQLGWFSVTRRELCPLHRVAVTLCPQEDNTKRSGRCCLLLIPIGHRGASCLLMPQLRPGQPRGPAEMDALPSARRLTLSLLPSVRVDSAPPPGAAAASPSWLPRSPLHLRTGCAGAPRPGRVSGGGRRYHSAALATLRLPRGLSGFAATQAASAQGCAWGW